MGIEDIQISEELETSAAPIKYRGDEGPKSPQDEQRMKMAQLEEAYEQYVDEMIEMGNEPMSMEQFLQQVMAEGQMAGGQPLPNDPTKPVNPFQPKPTGPVLPDRQMAAYGGIMGLDGRKQYGIGSWFQEKIMDPIKNNPLVAAAALAGGVDLYRNQGDSVVGTIFDVINKPRGMQDIYKDGKKTGEQTEGKSILGNVMSSVGKNIVPIVGGLGAGLFTKSQQGAGGGQDASTFGQVNDQTAMDIQEYTKGLNLLDAKQMMASGQNFALPDAARKYSPAEMVEVYQNAANGGRIGFDNGGGIINPFNEFETFKLKGLGYDVAGKGTEPFGGESVLREILDVNKGYAMGGRIGFEEGGGIMDLGGMEKDYRAEGGFVPIGREEKADDVPARLSVNEFVFTADAVRNAGGGDIDQGAQVMENMMKNLEQGGQVSEESQGMQGARDMFATSERLGEVI